ncbi:hypothetical protein FRX31_035258 [Thalictrum thalictroides]|uniref:Uncharacterized protein n=1 Tax=Thalictrum thalictroides TaxID=46969 RepID=A0A7J6URF1_THATH|nr:hypothetical protein FRX31_035258 [Thalictrum thalictroides]
MLWYSLIHVILVCHSHYYFNKFYYSMQDDLRHRYACAVLREQGLREAAYDYSQQSYEWLQEARGMAGQYAIERQAYEGRIQELEEQVANMRIVIDDLEPRRRTRPRGRGRGDHASSQGSAHS